MVLVKMRTNLIGRNVSSILRLALWFGVVAGAPDGKTAQVMTLNQSEGESRP